MFKGFKFGNAFNGFVSNTFDAKGESLLRQSMMGWYDSSVGIILNGSTVMQWNDKSGRGYHLVQANALKQPLYVTSIVNSYPVLRFNAVEWMQVIYGATYNAPFTIFIVAKSTVSGLGIILDSYNNSSYIYHFTTSLRLAIGDGVVELRNTTTTIGTKLILASIIANGTSSKIYENSLLKISGNAGTIKYTGLTLGAFYTLSSFFKGDIAEIIIYNELLDDSNLAMVNNYLSQKYNTNA